MRLAVFGRCEADAGTDRSHQTDGGSILQLSTVSHRCQRYVNINHYIAIKQQSNTSSTSSSYYDSHWHLCCSCYGNCKLLPMEMNIPIGFFFLISLALIGGEGGGGERGGRGGKWRKTSACHNYHHMNS